MINEEITRRAITIEMKMAKASSKYLLQLLKKLQAKASEQKTSVSEYIAEQVKGNSVPIKDMVKKGQLEALTVADKAELKEVKKELNRHGVSFSVMKDKETGEYSVFFQSKDTVVMEKAFDKLIKKFEHKKDDRESTIEKLNKFKEKVKDTISKDKVKNKTQEQSL